MKARWRRLGGEAEERGRRGGGEGEEMEARCVRGGVEAREVGGAIE